MMTAEQLKNSILQLAMQGKLVPQDVSEEPAQELLERIRRKKKELIKAKIAPKDKKMDAVSEEEQLFDIPDSWVWTRIGELFQHNTGKALNGSNKEGTVLPYITTSNLYWNRFELDVLKEMPFTDSELDKCTAKKGDLLVCEGGDYGRAAIWNYDYDICIQNHVHKLRPYETVCVEFFYYVFNYLKNTGQIHGKGIAIQGLSSGVLHNLIVPLPPINEQYRIVEKIHSIIPVWEQYAEASTKINTLNTTFPDMMKKSILQEAVQGKLVPQDPNDEPASELLKRIAEEKQRLIKEGKIKKEKEMTPPLDDDVPFDIPDSWEWARFGQITYNRDSERIPLSVAERSIFNKEYDYYGASGVIDKVEDYLFDKPLLLIGEDGANLINRSTPIAFIATGKYWVNNHAHVIDMSCLLDMSYIAYYINSISLVKYVTGTAQPKMNQAKMNSIWVPVPPLEEQKRIVARLSELLPIAEELSL